MIRREQTRADESKRDFVHRSVFLVGPILERRRAGRTEQGQAARAEDDLEQILRAQDLVGGSTRRCGDHLRPAGAGWRAPRNSSLVWELLSYVGIGNALDARRAMQA